MAEANKIAIVTGGGRGIGRAIVERLRRDGATVVTCGRGERPADLPVDIIWVTGDVSRPEDASRIAATAAQHGDITVLVNNAGIQIEKTVPRRPMPSGTNSSASIAGASSTCAARSSR